MFISELNDLATPYEVAVQTLHNPLSSKSHPGNLNDYDIYTALEDIECNEKRLHEHEDNDNAIEEELPPLLYFTVDQVSSGFGTLYYDYKVLY